MSDGARATVIIKATCMVVDAAGKAIDAFKSFKSKPSSTTMGEFNTQVLNDSLSEKITANSEKLRGIAQEIAGEEDYRIVMGENLHGDRIPLEGEPKGTWNEELSSTAENVPPGYEEAASKFKVSGNLLRILNAILGIGLVVAMSFSLANDWNSLSDTGKVLGVLNVVVQGLTVLLDIIDVGAGRWALRHHWSHECGFAHSRGGFGSHWSGPDDSAAHHQLLHCSTASARPYPGFHQRRRTRCDQDL